MITVVFLNERNQRVQKVFYDPNEAWAFRRKLEHSKKCVFISMSYSE